MDTVTGHFIYTILDYIRNFLRSPDVVIMFLELPGDCFPIAYMSHTRKNILLFLWDSGHRFPNFFKIADTVSDVCITAFALH